MKTNSAPDVSILKELGVANKALAPAVKRLTLILSKLDPKKLPVGSLADLLYDLEQVGKQLSSLSAPFIDVLGPSIKVVETHFIDTLAVGESSGVQGMQARVQITDSVIPTIDDWDKFYEHIRKTRSFELLNRAPNRKAIVERWDAKKQVPGVGKFVAKKVSCTKLGGKKK